MSSIISKNDLQHHKNHKCVVLFYKYFIYDSNNNNNNNNNDIKLLQSKSDKYVSLLVQHQRKFCSERNMRGRILISVEGINGTLSAETEEIMEEYINMMERFTLSSLLLCEEEKGCDGLLLFSDIHWKRSSGIDDANQSSREPFPDLKVTAVDEIVSTGHTVHIHDIPTYGGTHLSPQQFHSMLLANHNNNNNNNEQEEKELVLIDVRNTFEHAIGHFQYNNHKSAINPQTTTFASFDQTYCHKNAHSLKDKRVLMYCTGGIRCEKASVMLKKRGVNDVYQLSGGIHSYLDIYGAKGFFKGKNFVFDQRVALAPPSSPSSSSPSVEEETEVVVVGKCIECSTPYDTISGAILCTVCRDLILICTTCQTKLLEYHCTRHASWKHCYYTFLEPFTIPQLQNQIQNLQTLLNDIYVPPKQHKNVRKTLRKQILKVQERIRQIQCGDAVVVKREDVKRRCRTCGEVCDVCDGLCWGFWRHSSSSSSSSLGSCDASKTTTKPQIQTQSQHLSSGDNANNCNVDASTSTKTSLIKTVNVGDRVQPGPDWNEIRLGTKYHSHNNDNNTTTTTTTTSLLLKQGTVVQLKTWGSGGDEYDCVSVVWDDDDDDDDDSNNNTTPQIYRWGVMAQNGKKMYDVEHFET